MSLGGFTAAKRSNIPGFEYTPRGAASQSVEI